MKPTPLFTLTDPPRGELPGESWRACCEQERAYTLGWRARMAGLIPCPFTDYRARHWWAGFEDGRRKLWGKPMAHMSGGGK